MSIERVQQKKRMSRAVIHQGIAYLCGQVTGDETLDIQIQTRSMLERVDQLLTDINTDKSKLLSATIYLADMKDFDAMNQVWDNWVIEGHAPARACGEAKLARPELKVEIIVDAAYD